MARTAEIGDVGEAIQPARRALRSRHAVASRPRLPALHVPAPKAVTQYRCCPHHQLRGRDPAVDGFAEDPPLLGEDAKGVLTRQPCARRPGVGNPAAGFSRVPGNGRIM